MRSLMRLSLWTRTTRLVVEQFENCAVLSHGTFTTLSQLETCSGAAAVLILNRARDLPRSSPPLAPAAAPRQPRADGSGRAGRASGRRVPGRHGEPRDAGVL